MMHAYVYKVCNYVYYYSISINSFNSSSAHDLFFLTIQVIRQHCFAFHILSHITQYTCQISPCVDVDVWII